MALKHAFDVTGKSLIIGESLSIDKGEVTAKTEPLYVRVESVNATKKVVRCRVMFYEKEGGDVVAVKPYAFAPNMDGRNFIAQSYEHLKTLPEFSGAADC